MIKHLRAAVVIGSVVITPALAYAQQTGGTTQAPACDCPLGDNGGDLRNLAAFAPLGFLGALAAAGGAPAIFAANPVAEGPAIASNTPAPTPTRPETETPGSDAAGNRTPPPADVPVAVTRPADLPDPVSPDSLRAGMRAPNTATPLPSVFLLGSGLLALGALTVARTR
jgi:hypothetical protein